jgi:hypothetical protein
MPVFVRGLWGDYRIDRYSKVVADVGRAMLSPQPMPCMYYCFGRSNADLLRSFGVEPVVLHDLPIVPWQFPEREKKRLPHDRREIVHHYNHWRHRLYVWHRAQVAYPLQWLWLDWDGDWSACRPNATELLELHGRHPELSDHQVFQMFKDDLCLTTAV